jgi:hypothetical protein
VKSGPTIDDFYDSATNFKAGERDVRQRAGVVVLDDDAYKLGCLVMEMTGRHTQRLAPRSASSSPAA